MSELQNDPTPDQDNLAEKVTDVVSILKEALARIENEIEERQPSTSSFTCSRSLADAVEKDLK